jgi:hypothetical protein
MQRQARMMQINHGFEHEMLVALWDFKSTGRKHHGENGSHRG